MNKKQQAPVSYAARPRCARCPSDAVVMVQVAGQKLSLCGSCDAELVRLEAEETCKAKGLDTTEKQRAWLRQRKADRSTQRERLVQREPGEDWQEDGASV